MDSISLAKGRQSFKAGKSSKSKVVMAMVNKLCVPYEFSMAGIVGAWRRM